jgi:alpha-L-fucosidase
VEASSSDHGRIIRKRDEVKISMSDTFSPNWRSLRKHVTPQWFRDAKFGIYTHWGVYSVPACGRNGSWYPYNMYRPETARDRGQYDYHVKTYGPPSTFGYKDFIPMFKGEKFDPDEWAELFKQAGARFAGPVGEHHDGFAMWDSQLTEWNAARMGPRRDVVGELERSIRAQGMRFMVALHHAENWWFFPHWRKDFDTSDPRYAGLYGPPHNLEGPLGPAATRPLTGASVYGHTWPFELQDQPSKEFLDLWKAKTLEVIDKYRPDLLWWDFALERVQEQYKMEFLAYYYNKAREWGKEVAVTYKWNHLVPGSAVVDLELGRFKHLTYHEWITDTSVDDQGAWSFVQDAGFKPVRALVHNLIDNVSKNGYLLLNVGPRADGTIPEPAKECLRGIGQWLAVNGEAIYETTPWTIHGEGPTQMAAEGAFSEEQEVEYTARDIRFTVKDDALYAICLGWPGEQVTINSVAPLLYPREIQSVTMLGTEEHLDWRLTPEGLTITPPVHKPCEHAYAFKIQRGRPF